MQPLPDPAPAGGAAPVPESPLAAPGVPVLRIEAPRAEPVPLVLDSPHSGAWFPEDFGHCVTERELRGGEDCWIDELFGSAPAHGATLLAANFARTYLDPNRGEGDVDPELVDGDWPHPIADSGKSRLGKALVWRLLDDGRPIYPRRLRVEEINHRIEHYLRPYHAALRELIESSHQRHGVSYHLNCHSMQAVAGPMSHDGRGTRRADVVLGDRDGSTCSAEFTLLVRDLFADAGYDVRINDPYKGVELVRAFSVPHAGRHSLQVEINRGLYMNESTLEKSDGFETLRRDLDRVIAALAEFARSRSR